MKIIYGLGRVEEGHPVYTHFYDNKAEAEKALWYLKYVNDDQSAFIEEQEIEEECALKVPDSLFVKARFNYRNNKCRYDHITLSIYPKVYSDPGEYYLTNKVDVVKSDRCGIRSNSVTVYFMIDTVENEERKDLESRCKDKTKEIYEEYIKGSLKKEE